VGITGVDELWHFRFDKPEGEKVAVGDKTRLFWLNLEIFSGLGVA
jgi:hypothetical protein